MIPDTSLQILILENEGLVRAGMKALIQIAQPSAQIHEASSYNQAISILLNIQIDLAFIDYDLMSDKNGMDVVSVLRERELDTRAIMLSGHRDKELVLRCIDSGACGYIPKGMDDENGSIFRRAIDTVFNGGIFLPAFVFGRGGDTPEPSTILSASIPAETLGIKGRKLAVLYYLCQGYPNKTIATKMGISEGTIRKDYVTELFRIFKVSRRTQLMVEVARRSITVPKPHHSNSLAKID